MTAPHVLEVKSAPACIDMPVAGSTVFANGHSLRHSSILAEVDEARKKAEIEAIVAALNSTRWNRKRAATLLNVNYKTLLYKMKKLGIGEGTGEETHTNCEQPLSADADPTFPVAKAASAMG
jgi:DNA-binding NtrC family response regulator